MKVRALENLVVGQNRKKSLLREVQVGSFITQVIRGHKATESRNKILT